MNFAIIPQCPRCGDDYAGDNVICDACRADGAHTTYSKSACQVCGSVILIHYLEANQQRTICDRVDCQTATAHLREAA